MAYSIDPEENKRNAATPSEHMSLSEQFMYRLASLDASVQGGFRRLDEKMDRFQSDLHESQIKANDRISSVDREMKLLFQNEQIRINGMVKDSEGVKKEIEGRITALETWKHVFVAKVGMVITLVIGVWTILAPTIRGVFGISNQ